MVQKTNQQIPQATIRQTKAEILDAYKELVNQYKQNLQQISVEQKQTKKAEKEKIIKRTTEYTTEKIVKNLNSLKIQIIDILERLASRLTQENSKLTEIQKAVEIEKYELEQVHKIKIESDTLMNLIRAQEEAKKQYQREEAEQEIEKSLKRKQEEMQYKIEQQEKRRSFQEQMQEKRTELEQREQTIKEQEQEIEELKNKALNFPKKLESEIKKARNKSWKKAKKQALIHAQLLAEKTTGEKQIAELKIYSLEEQVNNQRQEIENFKKQLEQAILKNQELASKVIEGAAGAKFLKLNQELDKAQKQDEEKERDKNKS